MRPQLGVHYNMTERVQLPVPGGYDDAHYPTPE
jgi:hypothetical protein